MNKYNLIDSVIAAFFTIIIFIICTIVHAGNADLSVDRLLILWILFYCLLIKR